MPQSIRPGPERHPAGRPGAAQVDEALVVTAPEESRVGLSRHEKRPVHQHIGSGEQRAKVRPVLCPQRLIGIPRIGPDIQPTGLGLPSQRRAFLCLEKRIAAGEDDFI